MSDTAWHSPPVQRAARLLRQIARGDNVANVSRTAHTIGINRTTLLRLLHTLEAERFIERDGSGWRIGPGIVGLAAQAFFAGDLVQTATPVLGALCEKLGLSAHLGVLDGREIIYVVRRAPNLAFASNIRVGSRLPAHASNMGRIILAHLPAENVTRLFKGAALKRVTAHTPVTLAALRKRLDLDRAIGLAWSDGFFEPGISSAAAAIFDATGAPVAALNVSGQSAQFGEGASRRAIGETLANAAADISQRLGWAGPRGAQGDAMDTKAARPVRARKPKVAA